MIAADPRVTARRRASARRAVLAAIAAGALALPLAETAEAQVSGVDLVVEASTGLNGVTPSPNRLDIDVQNRAILNYNRFDLTSADTVNFIQPSATATVLNRINSASPSSIDGTITGNGVIFFANPSGIVFGPNSVISAARFVGVAGDITDENFLDDNFTFATSGGAITHLGAIVEDAELAALEGVHLIGDTVAVEASSVITAPDGVVTLTSGVDVMLMPGDGNLAVVVDTLAPCEASGEPGGPIGLSNAGTITADEAFFAVGDVFSLSLSNTGTVTANGLTLEAAGNVEQNGAFTAADPSTGASFLAAGSRVTIAGTIAVAGAGDGEVDPAGSVAAMAGNGLSVTNATITSNGVTLEGAFAETVTPGLASVEVFDSTIDAEGGDFVVTGVSEVGSTALGAAGVYVARSELTVEGGGGFTATGEGVSADAGGDFLSGVVVEDSTIAALGTGNVTLSGVGGDGAATESFGVDVFGDEDTGGVSRVTAISGDLTILGVAGDVVGVADEFNIGASVGSAQVATDSGNISITGVGGDSDAGTSPGVVVANADPVDTELTLGVVSVSGDVTINGVAGVGGGSGVILAVDDSQPLFVVTGGDGAVDVSGVGSQATTDLSAFDDVEALAAASHGIVQIGDVTVSTDAGEITYTGTALDNGSTNAGVFVAAAKIDSASGDVTVTGNVDPDDAPDAESGVGSSGVVVTGGAGVAAMADGDLTVVGLSGSGASTDGVVVGDGGQVSVEDGRLTLLGTTNGDATSSSHGVAFVDGGTATATGGGDIAVSGIVNNVATPVGSDGESNADNFAVSIANGGGSGVFSDNAVVILGDTISLALGPAAEPSLGGGGDLTLAPFSLTQDIVVGTQAAAQDGLVLTLDDLSAIANGFASIQIGLSDGLHDITIGDAGGPDVEFFDPVTFGSLGSDNRVLADLVGLDDATITFVGDGSTTTLAADIFTAGNSVSFVDAVAVDGDRIVDTSLGSGGGADVAFAQNVDGLVTPFTDSIQVDAGAGGNIGFAGDIGSDVPLSGIDIAFASNVDLPATTTLGGGGLVVQNGNANLNNATVATQQGPVSQLDTVSLAGDSTIDTTGPSPGQSSGPGNTITLGATNNAAGASDTSLTLVGGDVVFLGGVGTPGNPVGAIVIVDADNVTASNDPINVGAFTQLEGTGDTTIPTLNTADGTFDVTTDGTVMINFAAVAAAVSEVASAIAGATEDNDSDDDADEGDAGDDELVADRLRELLGLPESAAPDPQVGRELLFLYDSFVASGLASFQQRLAGTFAGFDSPQDAAAWARGLDLDDPIAQDLERLGFIVELVDALELPPGQTESARLALVDRVRPEGVSAEAFLLALASVEGGLPVLPPSDGAAIN